MRRIKQQVHPKEWAFVELTSLVDALPLQLKLDCSNVKLCVQSISDDPVPSYGSNSLAVQAPLVELECFSAICDLTVVTPGFKHKPHWQSHQRWSVDAEGRLDASATNSSASRKECIETVSNAAPTFVFLAPKLTCAHTHVHLHHQLLPGLQRLGPLFAQFSPSSWTVFTGIERAWFNKLARCFRMDISAALQHVSLHLPCQSLISFLNLNVSNCCNGESQFASTVSCKNVALVDPVGSEVLTLGKISATWCLSDELGTDVAGSTTKRRAFLPAEDDFMDEFLKASCISNLHSAISVQVQPLADTLTFSCCSVSIAWLQTFLCAWRDLADSTAGAAWQLKQCTEELAGNAHSEQEARDTFSGVIISNSVDVRVSSSQLGCEPALAVQIRPGPGSVVDPCMTCSMVSFQTHSGTLSGDSAPPCTRIQVERLALFTMRRCSHPAAGNLGNKLTPALASACHVALAQLYCQGPVSALHETKTASAHSEVLSKLVDDIFPVAGGSCLKIALSHTVHEKLQIHAANVKLIYSNYSLVSMKQWVLSGIQIFRCVVPKPTAGRQSPNASDAPQDCGTSLTWGVSLGNVQALLFSAQDKESGRVRGSTMMQFCGSLRVETPWLLIAHSLRQRQTALIPPSTLHPTAHAHAHALLERNRVIRFFRSGATSLPELSISNESSNLKLPTPSSGANAVGLSKHSWDTAYNSVMPEQHRYSDSSIDIELPEARSKAAARDHALHFGAADVQVFYVPSGMGGCSSDTGDTLGGKFAFPWKRSPSPRQHRTLSELTRSLTEPFTAGNADRISGATERLILSRASFSVGIGMKSIGLIENFKLLHGSQDLKASTRVTVDVSDADIRCSIDELQEVVLALKCSLQQDSLGEPVSVSAVARNIALFVGELNVSCVDDSIGHSMQLKLTEVDVSSQINRAAIHGTVAAGHCVSQQPEWEHTLRISAGWAHAQFSQHVEPGHAQRIKESLPEEESSHFIGGCLLAEASEPHDHPMIVTMQLCLRSGGVLRRTHLAEAVVNFFPGMQAALVVNVDPLRVDFLTSIFHAMSGCGSDTGSTDAGSRLLGVCRTADAAADQPEDADSQGQIAKEKLLDVGHVKIARLTAIVSASGFLRKPLRHLQVDLEPFSLHDRIAFPMSHLTQKLASFYTSQVWDYVPKVLKKSILPNFKAPFISGRIARRREERERQFTTWQPGTQQVLCDDELPASSQQGGDKAAIKALLGI
jgi:hypothetical protein